MADQLVLHLSPAALLSSGRAADLAPLQCRLRSRLQQVIPFYPSMQQPAGERWGTAGRERDVAAHACRGCSIGSQAVTVGAALAALGLGSNGLGASFSTNFRIGSWSTNFKYWPTIRYLVIGTSHFLTVIRSRLMNGYHYFPSIIRFLIKNIYVEWSCIIEF